MAIPVGKQWGFEIYINIGTEDPIILSWHKEGDLLLTKEAAIAKMKQMIPGIARETCKAMGLPEPVSFHNLKTNTLDEVSEFENAKPGDV